MTATGARQPLAVHDSRTREKSRPVTSGTAFPKQHGDIDEIGRPAGYIDPELLPAPDVVERQGLRRTTLGRAAAARCVECGDRWVDGYALATAATHARSTGHVVVADHAVRYRLELPGHGVRLNARGGAQ